MRTSTKVTMGLAVLAAVGLGYGLRAARADGVPSTMTYTGTLEDPTGKPVSGPKKIGLTFYDAATQGTEVCKITPATVDVANGRFDVPVTQVCVDKMKANPNLWVEVGVEGESLGRAALGAVPYAVEAGAASEAKGSIDARLKAIENKKVVSQVPAFPGDKHFDNCNPTGTSVTSNTQLCFVMCQEKCITAGYVDGWFNGNYGGGAYGCSCLK